MGFILTGFYRTMISRTYWSAILGVTPGRIPRLVCIWYATRTSRNVICYPNGASSSRRSWESHNTYTFSVCVVTLFRSVTTHTPGLCVWTTVCVDCYTGTVLLIVLIFFIQNVPTVWIFTLERYYYQYESFFVQNMPTNYYWQNFNLFPRCV